MKTFVIFDRKTGEVLQTHVQTGELHSTPEELVKAARPEAKGVTVDVMEVGRLEPGISYRVDLKGKKLMPVDKDKTGGAGGGFVHAAAGDPFTARRVIFDAGKTVKEK